MNSGQQGREGSSLLIARRWGRCRQDQEYKRMKMQGELGAIYTG